MSRHRERGWTSKVAAAARAAIGAELSAAWQAGALVVCDLCHRGLWPGQTWHVDHIVPLADGGRNTLDNLRPVHATCNMAAGGKFGAGKGTRTARRLR